MTGRTLAPERVRALGAGLSRVCFRPLTVSEQRNYVASGERHGKAGSYAIQGLAAALVERL